jgi:hypothetical protein
LSNRRTNQGSRWIELATAFDVRQSSRRIDNHHDRAQTKHGGKGNVQVCAHRNENHHGIARFHAALFEQRRQFRALALEVCKRNTRAITINDCGLIRVLFDPLEQFLENVHNVFE